MWLHASLLLSREARLGHQLAEEGCFLNREEQGLWMRRWPVPVHLKAMTCGHQGHPPANDMAFLVKLGTWQAGEALFQLVLADRERGRKGGLRERLASAHLVENREAELLLLTL